MAVSQKGKFFCFLFFLIFQFPPISRACANPDTDSDTLNRHQAQLDKLEELVNNLAELVSRLESRISESSEVKILHHRTEEKVEDSRRKGREVAQRTSKDSGERVGAVSVTKHSLFWSERFQFVSAVRLDSNATFINVLPFKNLEGLSKYIAVGDDRGKLYIFSRYGEVMFQYYTQSDSPITALLSYISAFKNESMVVTGHGNGVVLVHRLWEVPNGDESYSLHMETVGRFSYPEGSENSGSPITMLEVHHVGRTRYILSMDVRGTIRVFREDGSIYGLVVPNSKPLAFLKQRLLFLTETGAGSLDLRTMKIREGPCDGLNNSHVRHYVFDVTERSKAFGFTLEGELIQLFFVGDVVNFKCRVRTKKKFDMDEPLAFEAIKGYLLAVNQEKVYVFNISSQHYVRGGGPRLIFSAGLDEIAASFLNYQSIDSNDDAPKEDVVPLIASNHEKLVILSLGSGYVGMYRSNLPVTKGEFSTMLWSTPVLFFLIFLFVAWHFFANKKDALTSWGPDDPFSTTSVTNAAGPSGSGERSFNDTSSRTTDLMDLRGGGGSGIRGPTRRYASPPRYSGAAANSFRPTPPDANNSRPVSVDPNYRAASELKFRGSNLESTGFPKRREGLYVNSQVVDDDS